MFTIERMGQQRVVLGEGPWWDVQDQCLFFVDIAGSRLWRFDPASGQYRDWDTPAQPAGISRTEKGGFIVALADGFYAFDPATGRFDRVAAIDTQDGAVQLNDAKVDRQGRFVAGEAAKKRDPIAAVHSFDGHSASTLDSGYTICNGPCWSGDGGTFYLADTIPNKLFAYDYDRASGAIIGRRLLADCSGIGGFADGATVDAEGNIWMAFCGEGRIVCFAPDGTIVRVLETEVKWVSSVQFGGRDLDQLYVTSFDPAAAVGRPPDDNSGYLYRISGLGAKGLAEPLARAPRTKESAP